MRVTSPYSAGPTLRTRRFLLNLAIAAGCILSTGFLTAGLLVDSVPIEAVPEPIIDPQPPDSTFIWPVVQGKQWHPPHRVRVWKTRYRGRKFRVTQLPRCEHIEAIISYEPGGETLGRAKKRFSGVAACTGSFHNSRTYALADFVQKNGCVVSGARTGRCFVSFAEDGSIEISRDYCDVKRRAGVSALALGQRLIPLQRDGFSTAFMNRVTSRMALGMDDNCIYIVQGKSDIWRLAGFMRHRLLCKTAINSDGGHVVRGRAPVHIVFRWRSQSSWISVLAGSSRAEGKG
ncbi:MAG: hypothetical protein ABFD54_14830 [Armatimonadota bacterium]|nr:hypothetical protein [bacterium]